MKTKPGDAFNQDPNVDKIMVHTKTGFMGRVVKSRRPGAQVLSQSEVELNDGHETKKFPRNEVRFATSEQVAKMKDASSST
jgi:hypothetical protein